MADCQITCIDKPHPLSRHEHITRLGNPAAGWIWSREEVIASIERGENTFYTIDPNTGRRAYLAVVREAGKVPYVQTHADGIWNNNLLSLTQCPLRIY